MLVSLTSLTPTMQEALRTLVDEITRHDGVSPINESGLLGIEGRREADFFFMGRRSDPYGFVVCDERDRTLMLGVHPDHRGEGVGAELLREAIRAHPESAVWAFGTLPGGAALAEEVGLVPFRSLLRMEKRLDSGVPDPWAERPAGADDVQIVTYTPDLAEAIVRVNAEAFAHHPEQGKLSLDEFHDLTSRPWFDPEGLFVAVRDGQVLGFHWTKRHGDGLGEVYVIAVARAEEGKGLGRWLLARGLSHLAARGDDRVQLYVEGDQRRVVDMYVKAGFEIVQTDTSYRVER